ncbi:uncharacterized protein B0J16DRAFT_400497 [Fusarium flagelliforme]|uniref:DUF7735 domain-containing protein n=1 Tax=Fusarium flagelliforme TaxID=2675880 RepID=A0A395MZ34_9HYPO|nr:uncharacterized protein B0J16DRAFT_400497 [Fusarium flagelliforme]KAH7182296.1 hypothetical protein B0J16DRAFT_400497 [Fusarium flagelliforme]RFN52997.1 hypothetical protein FIE12Z_2768 [Fusarium flagelliforme]
MRKLPVVALPLLQASQVWGLIYDTILPSAKPTITEDFRNCLIMDDPQPFFEPPEPTGLFSIALFSYFKNLNKDCPFTDFDVFGVPTCPYPELSKICSFTDVAPKTQLPAWSSHGSVASSWWEKHSSSMVEFADYCPNRWFDTMGSVAYGGLRLNNTISFAACRDEGILGDTLRAPKATQASTTASQQTITSTASAIDAEETSKLTTNGGVRRAGNTGLWKVAATGFAAIAVNSVLQTTWL